MKLTQKETKAAILKILTETREISFLDLEQKILELIPHAGDSENREKKKNGSTVLRNTIAWAKTGLVKGSLAHYPTKTTIAAGPAPEAKPKIEPKLETEDKEVSLLQRITHALEKGGQLVRTLLENALALAERLQNYAVGNGEPNTSQIPKDVKPNEKEKTEVSWKRKRPKATRCLPPKSLSLRGKLELVSDEIKKLQKLGKLPPGPINKFLKERYKADGHTDLRTLEEWKQAGKIPRKNQKCLPLWKKTESGRFLPLILFSAKQVVPIEKKLEA